MSRAPSPGTLTALGLATLVLLAPFAGIVQTASAQPPVVPTYPDEFKSVMQGLFAEMDAELPDLITAYNDTEKRLLNDARYHHAQAHIWNRTGLGLLAFEGIARYHPAVALLKATAEANETNRTLAAVALEHVTAHNASSHAAAARAHGAILAAERNITTTRSMELLLVAGYYLAAGKWSLSNFDHWHGELLKNPENSIAVNAVFGYSVGPKVWFTLAERLATAAAANDSKGTVLLVSEGYADLGGKAERIVKGLRFQPYPWFAKEFSAHAGRDEDLYLTGLYVSLNETLIKTEWENRHYTFPDLRAQVKAQAIKLEAMKATLHARGVPAIFAEEALAYHAYIVDLDRKEADSTQKVATFSPRYIHAMSLINRANDASLFILQASPAPASGTPTVTENGPVSWLQIGLGAVVGAAVAAIGASIWMGSRKK